MDCESDETIAHKLRAEQMCVTDLLISSTLAWNSVLAAFILLMTSPTFPTTAAKTKTPLKKVSPVKRYSRLVSGSELPPIVVRVRKDQ